MLDAASVLEESQLRRVRLLFSGSGFWVSIARMPRPGSSAAGSRLPDAGCGLPEAGCFAPAFAFSFAILNHPPNISGLVELMYPIITSCSSTELMSSMIRVVNVTPRPLNAESSTRKVMPSDGITVAPSM